MSKFAKVGLSLAIAVCAVALSHSGAEAAVCRARIDGRGTGQGLFGEGTAVARQAAIQDFEQKAANRFGGRFGSFSRARGVRWDCKKNAILMAKCVVAAFPCR